MSKKASVLILTLIMTFATLNFAYWINQKSGFHCDEIYSFGLSNKDFHYNIYDENGNIRWNNNEDIDSYMLVSENGRFDYKNVYENQISDVHPPFFYIIMHTISSFVPKTCSPFIVCVPNIFFTLGTGVFLYLIIMQLLKKYSFAVFTVFCFLFSVGCINIVTYMRMYAMLTFFTTAITYLTLKLIDNDYVLTKKLSISIFITVFLGAYTQYYFLIFMFALALFTVLSMRKDVKNLLNYLKLMGVTALFYIMVWPFVFRHIFASGRGGQAFTNAIAPSFLENLKKFTQILNISMGNIMFYIFLVFAVICFIMKKKNFIKNHKNISLIIFVSLFYFIVISKIAPFNTDRYIAPVFPLFTAVFVYMLHAICTRLQNKRIYVFMFVFVILCVGISENIKNVLYNPESSYNDINYLYRISDERAKHWEENKDKKCVMIHSLEWEFLRNLPDYKNYKETAFVNINDIKKLKEDDNLKNENEFILYIHGGLDSERIISDLQETLNFNNLELLIPADARNRANIFIVRK